MRDLNEELQKIIDFAIHNDNIRALVLQGSFVNDKIETDDFTDLDPLFFVRTPHEFTQTEEWKKQFGDPISEFNDEGEFHDGHKWYTRLTIFSDGFKIDFGFQSIVLAKYANEMPLYKILIDKDGIVPVPEVSDDSKFYLAPPSEEEFLSRMNAFFYDSSYVVKAIARNEIFFAQHMMNELHLKLHPLLDWYISIHHDHHVNPGLMGRYYHRYLNQEDWTILLQTYADGKARNIATSLLVMYDFVRKIGLFISESLDYSYPEEHNKNMLDYCKKIINKYITNKGE